MIDDATKAQAEEMLKELSSSKLMVEKTPAPRPQFIGHGIRSVISENPKWYKDAYADHGDLDKRVLINSLRRISNGVEKDYIYDEIAMGLVRDAVEEFDFLYGGLHE